MNGGLEVVGDDVRGPVEREQNFGRAAVMLAELAVQTLLREFDEGPVVEVAGSDMRSQYRRSGIIHPFTIRWIDRNSAGLRKTTPRTPRSRRKTAATCTFAAHSVPDMNLAHTLTQSPTDELHGLAGLSLQLMEMLGAPGAGVAVAAENLFPPIPSEVILPLAGFAASRGRSPSSRPSRGPPSAPSSAHCCSTSPDAPSAVSGCMPLSSDSPW